MVENPEHVKVAVQPHQNVLESPAAAASTSEDSRDDFSINDVPDPTLELLLDPLMHPDNVSNMMEFGRRLLEYT